MYYVAAMLLNMQDKWVFVFHKERFQPPAYDIFKGIFLNEKVWIAIEFSLSFISKVLINNIPALVWIMACCRPVMLYWSVLYWHLTLSTFVIYDTVSGRGLYFYDIH